MRDQSTSLAPEDFLQEPRVEQQIKQLQHAVASEGIGPVSDVTDDAGHQYVDLVMEGGGVLGIALVGYCYALEQAGIRFRSVAGTSAGAITAMFLQVVAAPGEEKTRALISEIANMPLKSFQDGGSDARSLVSSMLEGSSILRKLFDLRRNRSELTEKFGINPGDAFHSWVRKRLAHYDIHSLADLDEQLAIAPRGIAHQKGEASIDLWRPKLAVVTTELSSGRKVVFPRHANLFYSTPNKASPADFVRASMSVPYFFEPFRIDPIPQSPAIDAAWDDFLDSSVTPGSLTLTPRAAMFVDGGLLSNFPISEFHRSDNKAPTMPTFGIKLGYDGGKVEPPKKLLAFTGRLISAMRYDADAEFLAKNQEYKHLIGRISTAGYHWLDFEMPPEDKIGLFYQGVIAGVKFLQTFNWKAYKAMRS